MYKTTTTTLTRTSTEIYACYGLNVITRLIYFIFKYKNGKDIILI